MGDLLPQLTVLDVDMLTPSSLVSCPTVLARRVTSRPARRRILEVYVNSKTGSVHHPRIALCSYIRPSGHLVWTNNSGLDLRHLVATPGIGATLHRF